MLLASVDPSAAPAPQPPASALTPCQRERNVNQFIACVVGGAVGFLAGAGVASGKDKLGNLGAFAGIGIGIGVAGGYLLGSLDSTPCP